MVNKMQDSLYDPNTFWDKRCILHGHTGYKDDVVYLYDQPLRLRAVRTAITRSRIYLNEHSQILDIGCGVGDFISELSKTGASISGIDISNETIKKCKIRFRNLPNVILENIKLEDMNFKNNQFDLVVSITVLQHIINPHDLSRALTNLLRVTKNGAYIFVLEISPVRVEHKEKFPNYISLKTRNDWINLFTELNCSLIYELSLPQFGVRALRFYDSNLSRALSLLNKSKRNRSSSYLSEGSQSKKDLKKYLINASIRKLILTCMAPLDLIFMTLPFPKTKTDLRLLVFRKQNLVRI